MKQWSVVFLRGVVVLIGIVSVVVILRIPLSEGRTTNLDLFSIYADPFILLGYAASTPFFIALYKAYRLLVYIGQNKVFTQNSVNVLRSIRYCAIAQSIFIAMAGLYIKIFHHKDDDPTGFLVICVLTTFFCVVVAIAVSVFEEILQNGVDLKSEKEKLSVYKSSENV